MTINQKGSNSTRIPINTLNTIIDQVSNLQEDLGEAQANINNLGTVLGQTNSRVTAIEDNHTPTFNTVNANKINGGSFEGTDATIDTINATTVNVGNIKIDSTQEKQIKANGAEINNITAQYVDAAHTITANKVNTINVESNTIVTKGITNSGDYSGKKITGTEIGAVNVETNNLTVTDKTTVKDLEVNGTVTGVGSIELDDVTAESVKAESVDTDKLITGATIMSDINYKRDPNPLLDNNDRYTIELPSFTGTMNLTWKGQLIEDGDEVNLWNAVVTGNGKEYTITWSTIDNEIRVTDIFQYAGKLYIRTLSNGGLYYSYNATKELEPPHIYYNMGGWGPDKSLEELTDVDTHYVATATNETVQFGTLIAPKLTILFTNLDSVDINTARIRTIIGPVEII